MAVAVAGVVLAGGRMLVKVRPFGGKHQFHPGDYLLESREVSVMHTQVAAQFP
jgi:hypothetical protein